MPDPSQPGPALTGSAGAILASDRERDLLVERLSAACADGRLDLADFSDRLEAALSARTVAEIQELEGDLGPATPVPLSVARSSGASWFVGIMSSAVRKGRWVLQPKTHALALMGECLLDLRGAEVLASYSHITAVAVMGSVRVIVPEGIDVDVNGLAIMGAKTLRIGSGRPLPGSPSIRITAYAVMGEVSVVSKPPKGEPVPIGGHGESLDGLRQFVQDQLTDKVDRHLSRHERHLADRYQRRPIGRQRRLVDEEDD